MLILLLSMEWLWMASREYLWIIFSVRGSSGLHLRSIPLHTLRDFQRLRPYDLIVVQYGLNVATERGVKIRWL